MVAPNGARKVKKDHPEVPLTIQETVEVARNCYEAGAGAIHLHVRNEKGEHVLDAGLYKEALKELEFQVPKMHIQVTTEAVGKYSFLSGFYSKDAYSSNNRSSGKIFSRGYEETCLRCYTTRNIHWHI